jgi:putative endonuclease
MVSPGGFCGYNWGTDRKPGKPTMSTQKTGQRGEDLAAAYLQHHGYDIIATNWRCHAGEIDIIARQGRTLVFVEVRARHASTTESAFESISPRKRERLVASVHQYLSDHDLETAMWRVDVIAVALARSGKADIDHVEDALDW